MPFGDYLIAEAVLPVGATTYILSARNTTGDPDTGYRVTLDEANPELLVRIYNFSPELRRPLAPIRRIPADHRRPCGRGTDDVLS